MVMKKIIRERRGSNNKKRDVGKKGLDIKLIQED
jgi:hypothetical protein